MVLIFTGKEQLDKDLNKKIPNSRVVYYHDYVLEEKEAPSLIFTVPTNKLEHPSSFSKISSYIKEILELDNI